MYTTFKFTRTCWDFDYNKFRKLKEIPQFFSDFTVIWRHPSVDKLQKVFGSGLYGFLGALHDQMLQ